MKQAFQEIKFRTDTLAVIGSANAIIRDYEQQGFRLTLRQLYYQFVARGLRENTERSYKQLGDIISNGRLAGLIDWDAIEDRTRNLRSLSHFDDPADLMQYTPHWFRLDKWDDQPNRVEVWVEKDALVGVIERICNQYDVPFFACRGYTSQSEMYGAAQRLASYINAGQDVHILHLGDHDPSGIDMTRDVQDRLDMFLEGLGCDVNRLALNWDQVQTYNPPPNPAKITDSRFDGYQRKFGDESWELDALEPRVISDLIETHILDLRDDDQWDISIEREKAHKSMLRNAAEEWGKIETMLTGA
jgi:hypothetical protein